MPTDRQIFISRHTDYADVKRDADVAKYMAVKYDMSEDGLRGTISRSNTVANRLALTKALTNPQDVDPSVKTQKRIIEQSNKWFNAQQTWLETLLREAVGVFISDKHNPYSRHDAWELTIQILDDMPQVDYISVQNDWNDNRGYGRWDDTRSAREKVWSQDFEYSLRLELNDYATLKMVAPNAMLLAIMGNHDKWLYKYHRTQNPQGAEYEIASLMQKLHDAGVQQFTRGFHENALRLSEGLIWVHGLWSAKRSTSNARNAVRKFTKNGVASSVVFGHTHRGSITDGRDIDINGITIVNNHSLCRNTDIEFIQLGTANDWTLGMTVCYFSPESRDTRFDLIQFHERGSELVAHYNGKRYTTERM